MSTTAYHNNSPVSSYKRNNQLVTTGYDADNCVYWYRIDFGMVREFSTALARDKGIDLVFEPVQNLDLPQLPAWASGSYEARVDRNLRRNRIAFQSKHGKRYPTFGVICLTAPLKPELKFDELTKNQQQAVKNFLSEAEEYFKYWAAITNSRNLSNYTLTGMNFSMDAAKNNLGNSAFKYAQFVSMGI